jgi:hypothetical protein
MNRAALFLLILISLVGVYCGNFPLENDTYPAKTMQA